MHRLVFEGRRDVGHAFSAVSLLLTVEDADASTSPTQSRMGVRMSLLGRLKHPFHPDGAL